MDTEALASMRVIGQRKNASSGIKKLRQQLCITMVAFALCSCATIAPLPPYAASDHAQIRSQTMDLKGVELGSFVSDVEVHPICRGGWAKITPGDEKNFESYVRHAVADELKLAIKDSNSAPRVTLTGHVERLNFSSTVDWLSAGYWDIRLRIESSNGHMLTVEQKNSFETGYHDVPACEKVAAQFPIVVRALISSLVASPDFLPLLK
jgi:hypothetical protein